MILCYYAAQPRRHYHSPSASRPPRGYTLISSEVKVLHLTPARRYILISSEVEILHLKPAKGMYPHFFRSKGTPHHSRTSTSAVQGRTHVDI